MYLTDLTFIEDGHPDLTPSGLINFQKRRQTSNIIRLVQEYQIDRYFLNPLPEVINLFGTETLTLTFTLTLTLILPLPLTLAPPLPAYPYPYLSPSHHLFHFLPTTSYPILLDTWPTFSEEKEYEISLYLEPRSTSTTAPVRPAELDEAVNLKKANSSATNMATSSGTTLT